MPSASGKQHRLMALVANNPAAAKRLGIPQSVGEEFMKADKGRKFAGGGMASKKLFGGKESYAEELKEAKAIKSGRITPEQYAREERKEERSMKMKKMADGGMSVVDRAIQANQGRAPMAGSPQGFSPADFAAARVAAARPSIVGTRGPIAARNQVQMAKGGSVMERKGMTTAKMGKVTAGGKRAHGEHSVQQKGHTKGKQVVMKRGGKC